MRLWQPSAKGDSVSIKGHTGGVRCVSFSQDDRSLLTASDDKTVKIWSLPSKKFAASLNGHSNWVRSAHFSPDSRLAVSGGDDRTVRLWDVESHKGIGVYSDHVAGVNTVGFHPDGTCVAAGSQDRTIKLWDLRSNALLQHYPAHSDSVTSISFHESGNYLLSSGLEGTLKIWDLREGQLLYTLHGHQGAATSAAFAPTGSFFASGGEDKMVMVWKSHLSSIVGGSTGNNAPAGGVSIPVTRPRVSGNGAMPLSYNSPRREKTSSNGNAFDGNATMARPMTAPTTGLRANASSPGGRGGSSPSKQGRSINALLPPPSSRVAGGGKEFVLEELAGGDVVDGDCGDAYGNAGPRPEGYEVQHLNKEQLPEVLAGALDHIVGQLDMMTRTLAILDKRLSLQEDMMAKHITMQGQQKLDHSSGVAHLDFMGGGNDRSHTEA